MKSSSSSKDLFSSFSLSDNRAPDQDTATSERPSLPEEAPAELQERLIVHHEVWKVVPAAPPQIERHCPRCQQKRGFACSDKFRINGHHKHLDVWLIYKCESCEYTWNYTLYERIAPGDLPAGLLPRLERNEQRLAWRYAFDLSRLRRFGAGLRQAPAFVLEQGCIQSSPEAHGDGWCAVDISAEYPLPIRLGVILARGLGRSRSQLTRSVARGDLVFASDRKAPLRRSFSGEERCYVRLP